MVPGIGAPTCLGLPGSILRCGGRLATCERSVTTIERGWPLSSKNTWRVPSSRTSLDGDEAHDQRLAALDVDADLLARLHAVEEHRRRQDRASP